MNIMILLTFSLINNHLNYLLFFLVRVMAYKYGSAGRMSTNSKPKVEGTWADVNMANIIIYILLRSINFT